MWKYGFWTLAIIGRLGDVDFIMTRINDPGWLGDTVRWLIQNPFWVTLLLVGAGLFFVGRDKLAAWRLQRAAALNPDQPQAAIRPSLPTWDDLERRFNELEPALKYSRIDGQTGAEGEYWRIAGGPIRDSERRFEALSAMASKRLFQDFPDDLSRYPDLASEPDAAIRWYKALRYIGGVYDQNFYGNTDNGNVFGGTILNPAAASATLCLQLASRMVSA